MKQQLIFLSFLSIVMFGIGFITGRRTTDPVSSFETKYVDRYIPLKTDTYALPSRRLVYLPLPIEKTRVDTVRVPVEITKYVVADPNKAIRTTPSKASFTYFDPKEQRYRTDEYTIPKRAHYFTAGIDGLYAPTLKTYSADVWVGFVTNKTQIMVGFVTNPIQQYPYVGLRYTFFN